MSSKAGKIFMNITLVVLMLFAAIPVIASDEITVSIPVSCTAKDIEDQFTYMITPVDNAPLPKQNSIELKNGGTGNFEISYTDPNTWQYEIKQEKIDKKDIKNDSTVYRAIVLIGSRDDGTLYSELSISKEGSSSKSASCKFENLSGNKTDSSDSKTDSSVNKTDSATVNTSRTATNTNPNTTYNNNESPATASDKHSVPLSNVKTGDENEPLLYLFALLGALCVVYSCHFIRGAEKNAKK